MLRRIMGALIGLSLFSLYMSPCAILALLTAMTATVAAIGVALDSREG
jgi:hypothetical protein